MRDQFGRVYHVEIDVDSLDPVGPIMLRDARPPVPVPDHYTRPVPGELGRIRVHLEEWRNDLLVAHEAWKRTLRAAAQKMYGDQAANALTTRPPALLDLVGPEPMPVEFCEAMIVGNKWALGSRLGKGFHPRPKWVTDELLNRLEKATRTVWNATDTVKAKPVDASKYTDEAYDDDDDAIAAASGAVSASPDADEDTRADEGIRRALFDGDAVDGLEGLDTNGNEIPAELGDVEPTDDDRAALLRDEHALSIEADAEARHLYEPETPRAGKRGGKRNGGAHGE
jgi:hypothetical protein